MISYFCSWVHDYDTKLCRVGGVSETDCEDERVLDLGGLCEIDVGSPASSVYSGALGGVVGVGRAPRIFFSFSYF